MILPLEKSPWIQAYQIRNYELGLLQDKTPWILGKYVNIFYDPMARDNTLFHHCMPEGRYFADSGAILTQRFRLDKLIFTIPGFDSVEWTKNIIKNGWYIMGYYDEYHIPERFATGDIHKRHSLLIYGFDDDEKVFYSMGYTSRRKYELTLIPYEAYSLSVWDPLAEQTGRYDKATMNKLEFDAFILNPEYDFQFDLSRLYSYICDYLKSEDCGCRNFKGRVYGINCEKVFVQYIRSTSEDPDGWLDDRYSRFFMEMKEMMLRRLEYLCETGIVSEELVEAYRPICRTQQLIHLFFLKYNITKKPELIDNICEKMNSVIAEECASLEKITESIFRNLEGMHKKEYF